MPEIFGSGVGGWDFDFRRISVFVVRHKISDPGSASG